METPTKIEHEKLPNPNNEWTLLEKLGEGTYGQVYRAKNVDSNEVVAAKIIRMPSNEVSNEFEHELTILKRISKQQENLPDFFGIFGDFDSFHVPRIWFVMELCSRGPIGYLLKQIDETIHLKNPEKEKLIAYALRSTLNALKYLHQSGIMHRDVKGSHMLVTENYTIKLIDFGVAGLFNKEETKRNSSVGTSLWMAPEVIACAHQLDYVFDERCDIWSLGITAIELAEGEAPLAQLHPTKVLFEIPRRPSPTLNTPTEWSENFSKFIAVCLIKDYEFRPRAEQLLTDESFVNFNEQIHQSYRSLLETYHRKSSVFEMTNPRVESEPSTIVQDDHNENPWILNISKSSDAIDGENNLAHIAYLDQQRLLDSIHRRFKKTLIYTYIGDVLLAINPKQYLPIDNLNFQLKYSKIRQDLLPHVFAIATNVYNQMLINHHAQCIILSGESGSGKTHAAQNLISELALLGFGEQRALENRLVTMNFLLEAFGNAQTALNNNSSRFGKLLEIFFSEYGTIVYVKLSEFLLEKTRVVLASRNTRNFHIFYSIFSHFSNPQSTKLCEIIDQESFDLFQTIQQYTYLGKIEDSMTSSFALENLFQIFKELDVTDDERASILAILTAIIHLGNISFKPNGEINEPGCSIDQETIVHLNAVYRLLKIDHEQLIQSLCQASLMTRGETVTKLNTIAEAQQARDAMAKSLYSRLFDWIIFALNRYFRTELEYKPKSLVDIRKRQEKDLFNNGFSIRPKVSEDQIKNKRNDTDEHLSSISILDLFGFETFDYNSYEQLCINIANEQLQYFFRQHTFAWEMKEYENEGIEKTMDSIQLDFPNNRSILDMCLSKPIGLLALLDEESRFPQSTEFTLVNKWRENLNSPHFETTTPSSSLSRKTLKRQKQVSFELQPLFTIKHYAGNIDYTAKDFLEKNRDYVPIEIIDLLLQSEDYLVNLLFRSRLRKTGSVVYNEQEKQDKAASLFRSSVQKTATGNRTQGTVSTYFRYSLMELVSAMASAQPTFIRCLVPNRLPMSIPHITYDPNNYFPANFSFDENQFDENVVLEQIRYSGLLETIEIRRNGYSHRILFEDFVSVYSCLVDQQEKLSINNDPKQICQLILKKFNFTQYAIGKTKIFLKFHHIEQLNLAYKTFLMKIIRLQSRIRMYLTMKNNRLVKKNTVKSAFELSVLRAQAAVRGFLVRRNNQKELSATLTIQKFWRMWYERTQFKRRLLHYRNEQIQITYFLKQCELAANHLHEQLLNLEKQNQSSTETRKKSLEEQPMPKIITPVRIQNSLGMQTKRRVAILCEYYDKIHAEFLKKKKDNKVEEIEEEEEIPIDPPPIPPRRVIASSMTNTLPLPPPPPPPCPPPEFFQSTVPEVRNYKRMKSAPAAVVSHIDELKQLFAKSKSTESTDSVMSFQPISPPEENHSFLRSINHSNQQTRRRLSSTSSIIKAKSTGLLSSSTSSLLGDMILKAEDVLKLKENLRKTGLVEKNQTLRRKLPTESIQIDFRSVLRPTKLNRTDVQKN